MSKKSRLFAVIFVLVIALALGATAYAAWGRTVTKNLYFNNISIELNGSKIVPKDATGAVVEPFIIDGTTYLPVRAISEALGLTVSWDGETSTVIISDGSSTETPPKVQPETVTMGMKNALEKAKSYLKVSAFSYSGLIEQLEYSKFSHEEAVYGADNCGADWYEQAYLKAQSYLKVSSFSKQGLIDQLVYGGFTEAQAKYGVEKSGY